ncbi:hypothetical protein F2P56_018929, partial [Juglans regia]
MGKLLAHQKNLVKKKIVESDLCQICKREAESIVHAVWNCPAATDAIFNRVIYNMQALLTEPVIAEAMTLRKAMELCSDLGFARVVFEGDSQRCGRLEDQIALLKHKLYLIQQGLAFNGKRTKTARSQGKKFQVSVEQEATRLLGNLGWALMQQNNYIEAEDAYRRALLIASDNNKMCNLGICLMKQGRIIEAKETLRLVKPAVADGPRGTDSHLKAYERAQQMLKDLESEKMNKGGDRVEQRRLFDAFLGSSSIWQPQPCKDHASLPISSNSVTPQDGFTDENINSNIMANQINIKQIAPNANFLNVAAPPFFSSKYMKEPIQKDPVENQFPDSLKRTRSGNAASSIRVNDIVETGKPLLESGKSENKTRRLSVSSEEATGVELTEFLPDNKDFEDAIIAAVLGTDDEAGKAADNGIFKRKIEKRL